MKQRYCLGGMIVIVGILVSYGLLSSRGFPSIDSVSQPTPIPTPLMRYAFDNLSTTTFPSSPIALGEVLAQTATTRMQTFSWRFPPRPGDPAQKTVTGVINLPKASGTYPILLMLRGYIPPEKYKPGAGTQPSAAVFSTQDIVTIAPDFLGFGGSDARSEDAYEARFQTYTTTLSLLSSLSTLNIALDASYSGQIRVDPTRIGLWGHSNGGHIALATLAITRAKYPTVLWAPVSKSFPYSVLAFSDEDDDRGKSQRAELARFETLYDTALFDPAAYYDRIDAPLQIHQGTVDTAVPFWWSDELVKTLKRNDATVEYHVYPGSDHNLRPAWNEVVKNSMDFYTTHLSK